MLKHLTYIKTVSLATNLFKCLLKRLSSSRTEGTKLPQDQVGLLAVGELIQFVRILGF